MKDKRSFMPPAVGVSSLLVIFAVLCTTIFALLSISTVRADVGIGESSALASKGWYEADYAANEMLARLREGEVPGSVSFENGIYSYSCPITETQLLQVEVKIAEDGYTILRWQAQPSAEWQADDRLPVWDGGKGG